MESRPQYLEAEIITAETFKQTGSLGDELDIQKVKNQLEILRKNRRTAIDELDKTIIDLTNNDDESKHQALAGDLEEIYREFQQPADEALAIYEHEVKIAKTDALDVANLSLALIIFKKNIIIALQLAAHTASTDEDIHNRSKAFNSIFKNVSMLNHDHGIYHHTAARNEYSTFDLNEWQNMLSNLLNDCTKYNELQIREIIIKELLSLNDMAYHHIFQCNAFISIESNSVSFTKNLHDAESRVYHFPHLADKLSRSLQEKRESTLSAFIEKDVENFNTRIAAMREKIITAHAEVRPQRLAPQPIHSIDQKSFWQRHKKIIIGALIGLAIIATTAIIIGSIIASGGAAAAAIAAFGGVVVATCGVAGTTALCVTASAAICAAAAGIGFASKKVEERKHASKRPLQQQSSTANNFEALGVTRQNLAPISRSKKLANRTNEKPSTAARIYNPTTKTASDEELLHHTRSPEMG